MKMSSSSKLATTAGPSVSRVVPRPGGTRSKRCLHYDVELADGELWSGAVESWLPHTVEPGDVLEYDVYPADPTSEGVDTSLDELFAGTAVSVVIQLDDHTDSTEHALFDQHLFRWTPDAQNESKSIIPGQWTRKRVDLSALAGRTITGASVTVVGTGSRAAGWVDGPRITGSEPEPDSCVDRVDTTRGTNSSRDYSRGNNLPASAMPFGFAFLIPVTDATTPSDPYVYLAGEPDSVPFEGMAISHLASVWIREWGGVQFLPRNTGESTPWRFSHDHESARPYEYRLTCEGGQSVVAIPTRSGGLITYDFNDSEGRVLIGHGAGPTAVREVSETLLLGYSDVNETIARNAPRVYFAARFSTPVSLLQSVRGAWSEVVVNSDRVSVAVATSFISEEQAVAALEEEIGDKAADQLRKEARDSWEELLGSVSVVGASPDQLASLYSGLYRVFLYPNEGHELVDGRPSFLDLYSSRRGGEPVVREGTLYINNGFWDTYRTSWPAFSLLQPSRAAEMVEGFVNHARCSGWVPRWSAPGPADCMPGTGSDNVIGDAFTRDVPIVDIEAAYDTMVRNATTVAPNEFVGRKGMPAALFMGYTPTDIEQGLSWAMEGALSDFAIARTSEKLLSRLGDDHPRADELRANARWFGARSKWYQLLFDPATGFFRTRDRSGAFAEPFSPEVWTNGYAETTAWGMAFTAPHDGNGLVELYGGKDRLESKLDQCFATPETGTNLGTWDRQIHEMVEARDLRWGMCALSNQPAHHIPYMYAFTNAPHKTQSRTREALRRFFIGSDFGQGYLGDEDNGEMSGWYFFSALGLYPLRIGAADFVLTAPLFDRMEVKTETSTIVVETTGNGPNADYIQSVRINGEPWTSLRVPHGLLARDCLIEVELGTEPSDFGVGSFDGDEGWRDDLLVDAYSPRDSTNKVVASFSRPELSVLVDDKGADVVAVRKGDRVTWAAELPFASHLYTVSSGPGGGRVPVAWSLFGITAEGEVLLDRRRDEQFRWPNQTRAFMVNEQSRFDSFAIQFDEDAEATQVELLVEHKIPTGVQY